MAKKKNINKKSEKIDNQANKITEKSHENKTDRQLMIIFVIIAVMALFFIIILAVMQSSSKFTYKGIDFEISREGDIKFYTANVPIKDYAGNIKDYLVVDFRNDPRLIGDIPVNLFFNYEGFEFLYKEKVYISYDLFGACNKGSIATFNLGRFMSSIGLDAKAAMNDPSYADNENMPYINCNNAPNNTVIRIVNGTENSITQQGNNCYVISFKDCEILQSTERFELAILEQYVGRL